MIIKKVIDPHRIRTLQGGFSYIPHRFLTDGFLASLSEGIGTDTLVQNFINTVSSRPKGEILAALADSKISRYARNDKYVTELMKRST